MKEQFKYDVFISYSSKDKLEVRELAARLRRDGVRVWFDEWEIKPGDAILFKIEEGLEQSRVLVLAMSRNSFDSEWVKLERHTAMFRDPTNQLRRFIPLRLDDAEIKDTLKQYAFIDWRRGEELEYVRLLTACRLTGYRETPDDVSIAKPNKISPSSWRAVGVRCVAMMADGLRTVSGADNGSVRVWSIKTGRCTALFEGHRNVVSGVSVSSDGTRIASSSWDHTLRVWDVARESCVALLEGHVEPVYGVSLTADGRLAVSGSRDKTVRVWDIDGKCLLGTFSGHTDSVSSVVIAPGGGLAVSGSLDKTVRVWDIDNKICLHVLEGHAGAVRGVALAAHGQIAISGSEDKTVRVWHVKTGRCLATLEGHTRPVFGVAVTLDGKRAISGSEGGTIIVWDVETGGRLTKFEQHPGTVWGVAVAGDGKYAISSSTDRTIRVWELPEYNEPAIIESQTSRYTNAKVLLVGDSGVGKSGLALRLTEDRFEPTISTDAVWATQLKLPHDVSTVDTEREIWLWDFAGQSDYRLIHQLFMDETALAVLVFNPQSDDPFDGLGQWDRDLQRAARRSFKKLLVAGRCDRGGAMVSRASIDRFILDREFAGYYETSAYKGDGCQELKDAIVKHIPWDDIPWTASPRIFKLLKEEIVKLKDEGKVLLRTAELKQQLEMRMAREGFTLEELRAVVGLLVGPGVVWQLEFGDFVLLKPERVNAYAAAVIRTVRSHTDEIGSIFEEDVMAGNLDYQGMERLPSDEEQIVLRAMHEAFVNHGLCLREHTEKGPLLVFPSYFKRERPELSEHPSAFVTYSFSGMLDEIYATLVVRLHHTATFERDQLWRFAADFKTLAGKRVGLKMTKKPEGAAEITVYFDSGIPDETKLVFISYVHEHLKSKDSDVVRVRHYVCPNSNCNEPVEGLRAIRKAIERGVKEIPCQFCSQQIPLLDLIEEKFASEEVQRQVSEMEKKALISIDNESRELILLGHAFSIAGEAGQIFRPVANSDWGIDGEIEFKNDKGEASGRRVYLQLKSGDSYLYKRQSDSNEIFTIKNPRHAEYWQSHEYPVMLVIRTSDGVIRWLNVSEYLKRQGKVVMQVIFDGEPFTAQSVWRMRDRILASSGT